MNMDSNRSQSHSNQTMQHPTQRKTGKKTKTGSLMFSQSRLISLDFQSRFSAVVIELTSLSTKQT